MDVWMAETDRIIQEHRQADRYRLGTHIELCLGWAWNKTQESGPV